MKNSRKYALIVACVAAACLIAGGIFVYTKLAQPKVRVADKTFKAEYRRTEAERHQGLSGRASYPADKVMVFEFKQPDKRCFWMKDMKFSIDMVWLDPEKKVIGIEENVSPDTYPQDFCRDNAQYVLEFSAGTIRSAGLHTGDPVIF